MSKDVLQIDERNPSLNCDGVKVLRITKVKKTDEPVFFVKDALNRYVECSSADVEEAIQIIREKMPLVKEQLERLKLALIKAVKDANASDETNPFHSNLVWKVRSLNAKMLGYEYDIRMAENAIDRRILEEIIIYSQRFKRVAENTEFVHTDITRIRNNNVPSRTTKRIAVILGG